jgi:uncharacterized protein Yka (UPF0111/DUF47 family)
MQSIFLASVGIVLACGLRGCNDGPYEKNQAAAKDLIKAMNEIAGALETIKNKETARQAAAKIEKSCDKLEEIAKSLEKLPKLSKELDDKLAKELDPLR